MTLRLSTGAKNGLLDSGLDTVFDNSVLELWTGTQPASAHSAATGTKVWSSQATGAFAGASGGVKVGTYPAQTGVAAGDAGWFRLKQSTDAGGTDGTDERIDGSVTASGGGGDLTLDNVTIASGQTVTISAVTIGL